MINEPLIRKLIREACSAEELIQLRQYWEGKDRTEIEKILRVYWGEAIEENETHSVDMKELLWRRLDEACIEDKRQKPQVNRQLPVALWWAVSAAVALLLAVGGTVWLAGDSLQQDQIMVEEVNNGMKPMRIELEDGSVVWLNHNSRLIYPQPFDSHERYTELTGEGFFEISKDPERPFLVQTGNVQTRVLGTVFNLKAEKGDSLVQIALVEGSVEVQWDAQPDSAIVVAPGEQVTYNRNEQRVQKGRLNEEAPYAWKDEVIYFQKADVEEVASTLESWYGIPISIEESSDISGRLVYRYDTNKLTIEEVIERISTIMDYYFEPQKDGSLLILKKKRPAK